jgi:hypothetical protein
MPRDPDHKCSVHAAMNRGLSHEEAILASQASDAATIAKFGWCGHYVFDDVDSPTGLNIHTHGLRESYGHPDLQIVLPLAEWVAHAILINLAAEIKAGRRFAPGDVACGIIEGYFVGFAAATECGREVLRVIIPGPDGRLARGEIGGGYEVQYEGTD